MAYKNYRQSGTGFGNSFDDAPAAQATWNLKDDQRRILAEKLNYLIELVARCKVHDLDAMKKVNAALEVIYEIIRPGFIKHFKEQAQLMDDALTISRSLFMEALSKINQKGLGDPIIGEFVISVDKCYRMLNNAMYLTGLGITFEQKMSQKEMLENSLLD